jgi:Cu(I)/Ag(I) efflux system membrane protein CusA/SilA
MSRQAGATNVFAERASNRPYLEIVPDRKRIARYGIKLADVQRIIMTGIGGMNIGTVIEGRQRFPIRVRYSRELRDNVEAIRRLPVPSPSGVQVPLQEIADIRKVPGPAMIQSENTLTYSRVFINIDPKVVGTVDFVERGKKVLGEMIERGELELPAGYYISWSGQYEAELEARNRLLLVLPLVLLLILFILYTTFKSAWSVALVATSLPVSLMGGVLLLFFFGYNFSVAVWVGFIALFGVATDNAVVLVKTLDNLFREKAAATIQAIREDVIEGSLLRVRPIVMTNATTIIALIPILFLSGSGSEVMRPMATPTIGGLVTATLSNLILVPVLYAWVRERKLRKEQAVHEREAAK